PLLLQGDHSAVAFRNIRISAAKASSPDVPVTSARPAEKPAAATIESVEGALGARESSRRWALLVGVNDYVKVERLQYCSNDMTALRDELIESGFKRERVMLLNDSASENRFRPFKA